MPAPPNVTAPNIPVCSVPAERPRPSACDDKAVGPEKVELALRSPAGATVVRAAQSALPSNVLHVWDDACPGPSAVHSMASAVAFAKSQFRWTMARSPFFGLLMWINGSQTPTSVFLESRGICDLRASASSFFALLVFWSAGVGIASTQSRCLR